ncbi:MAG: hypothetical protein HRT45_19475, partial [Bdellovibrionales bacterium]|nr:hypothetical protein [Bdellovibrionales bacterium]
KTYHFETKLLQTILVILLSFFMMACGQVEFDTLEKSAADTTNQTNSTNIEQVDTDNGLSNDNEDSGENVDDGDDGEDGEDGEDGDDGDVSQCDPEQNLIDNGDFEVVDERAGNVHGRPLDMLSSGQRWDVYNSLPSEKGNRRSWKATKRSAGIEVQYSKRVIEAYSGNHLVELDSHKTGAQADKKTNSKMKQKVYLEKGHYNLTFAVAARTNNQHDNMIRVSVRGKAGKRRKNLIKRGQRLVQPSSKKWEVSTHSFRVKEAGYYVVKFAAKGQENTLGALLDDISLHRTSCGCESASSDWLMKMLRRHLKNSKCSNADQLEENVLEQIEELINDNSCVQQD